MNTMGVSAALVAAVVVAAAGACAAAEDAARPGLAVREGKLYRGGKPYRGVGVNYCDLFQELIANGNEQRTLNGLRYLGQKKIPFVRFWACGFWPSDWDLYFKDKEEWFRRLDRVVKTAEDAGVGLIPDFFWRTETYPNLFSEYHDQWGNPESKTRQFMATYVKEVVTRYANSPAIWGWEFANEMNLACDLPNGMEFLGVKIPELKVDISKDGRNLVTYKVAGAAFKAFAEEVRRYDPHRFITTGNSEPRSCSWHNATDKSWAADDRDQAAAVFQWLNPAPVNVVSVHFYPQQGTEPQYAGLTGIGEVLARYKESARALGQPLFVGEFAPAVPEKQELTMEQFRAQETRVLDAMLQAQVDLAAYWVFDYTADRKGPGLARRDNEYAWVIDQIADYNARFEQAAAAR